MSENEFEYAPDEGDVNPNEHLKLVKAINKLDKTQHIQKPSRDGYSDIKSEFHVRHSRSNNAVAVSDLINILQKTSEHVNVSKQIKIAQSINQTLSKPAERHEAEKIIRDTGFEEVKKSLGKWDAIVSRNRTLEHQKFPLNNDKVEQLKSKEYLSKFSIKSDLENEINAITSLQNEDEEDGDENTFPMTMNELIEHRKETARLRAKQSYKEAKARRQSKIKSKKFHRIQRKEKIKQQLKEFEQLQKTDPEEALKRLEQLEKTRALERVTLRHKSTGQWAKNKLVRAKYDKETRQQLAEQLSISRDLTQKQKAEETESEDDNENGENDMIMQDSSNPWLSQGKDSNEVSEFNSGYRKYWEKRNQSLSNSENIAEYINSAKDEKDEEKNSSAKIIENYTSKVQTLQRKRKIKESKPQSTTEWMVEEVEDTNKSIKGRTVCSGKQCVDEMFDEAEWKLQKTFETKLNKLKSIKSNQPKKKTKIDNTNSNKDYGETALEFKKRKVIPEIVDELNESTKTFNDQSIPQVSDQPTRHIEMDSNPVSKENDKIDPNKFVAIKPRHLKSALPDLETEGDHMDDDEEERKLTIAEAFEDDDIVAEFQHDKENEVNKDKPKIEDLTLPGWGSWVGKNMKQPKRRRMIFKTPPVVSRKDDKKDNVYINENKSAKLRTHQVSELPFPFTSVADFEASIRAPLGNTFIPESAHKKHIKPAVVIKKGVIIEPMDESQLINKKMTLQNSDSKYDKPLFEKVRTKKAVN